MTNLILDNSTKQTFMENVLYTCRDLGLHAGYAPNEDVFAGHFFLDRQSIAVLLLTEKNYRKIYCQAENIRKATLAALIRRSHVFVMTESDGDHKLAEWYHGHISFHTANEHPFRLDKRAPYHSCFKMFKEGSLPQSGLYMNDNIAILQFEQRRCHECGKLFSLPVTLLLNTADRYNRKMFVSPLPFDDKRMACLQQLVQDPFAKISLSQFSDTLFMQLRAHLRRGINTEFDNNPYNHIAQPVVMPRFSDEIPFVCPHCLGKAAIVHRDTGTITHRSEYESSGKPEMMTVCRISLEPGYIRQISVPEKPDVETK